MADCIGVVGTCRDVDVVAASIRRVELAGTAGVVLAVGVAVLVLDVDPEHDVLVERKGLVTGDVRRKLLVVLDLDAQGEVAVVTACRRAGAAVIADSFMPLTLGFERFEAVFVVAVLVVAAPALGAGCDVAVSKARIVRIEEDGVNREAFVVVLDNPVLVEQLVIETAVAKEQGRSIGDIIDDLGSKILAGKVGDAAPLDVVGLGIVLVAVGSDVGGISRDVGNLGRTGTSTGRHEAAAPSGHDLGHLVLGSHIDDLCLGVELLLLQRPVQIEDADNGESKEDGEDRHRRQRLGHREATTPLCPVFDSIQKSPTFYIKQVCENHTHIKTNRYPIVCGSGAKLNPK